MGSVAGRSYFRWDNGHGVKHEACVGEGRKSGDDVEYIAYTLDVYVFLKESLAGHLTFVVRLAKIIC